MSGNDSGVRPPMMRLLLIDGQRRPIFYRELQEALAADYLAPDLDSFEEVPDGVDLALVSDEFDSRAALIVQACRRRGIPTLHIPDGIVEWHNTWENPRSASQDRGMPLFQPVLCDKIACFGRAHVRVLEGWGNAGKCEIVGMPRLDYALRRKGRAEGGDAFRLLVATARTPYFTPARERKVVEALKDLREGLPHRVGGKRLEVRWRLTGGLARELQLGDAADAAGQPPLAGILERCDAVVSTPSTLILEAMLHGLPVASLDYDVAPQYVHTAWTIGARQHIDGVIVELVQPPPARLLYQNMQLHDCIECRTPATPRLVRLVTEMVRLRAEQGGAWKTALPSRILTDAQDDDRPENGWDPARLHPRHPVFQRRDLAELQAELGHLHFALSVERSAGRAAELRERLRRYERYGCGNLLARLVATFPFPRRMVRAIRYWAEDVRQG